MKLIVLLAGKVNCCGKCSVYIICILLYKRGEESRPEYSNIGEVRCLIPTHVNVMALTATASKPSRDFIIHSLRMRKPIVVYIPPMKKNIYYAARSKPEMDEFVKQLASVLGTLRTNMPRLIIFCKRYDECSTMYSMFKASLGNEFTEPPGSPDKPKYHLVDMYTRCTEVAVKKAVLESFCSSEGKLRIVIGTIAFGMGIDSPDVRQTIHWGLSSDIESYVKCKKLDGLGVMAICHVLCYYTPNVTGEWHLTRWCSTPKTPLFAEESYCLKILKVVMKVLIHVQCVVVVIFVALYVNAICVATVGYMFKILFL